MTLPKGYERLENGTVRIIGSKTEHEKDGIKIECKHKYRNFFIGMGLLGFALTLFVGNVVFPEYFPSVMQQLMILGFIALGIVFLVTSAIGIVGIHEYFQECDTLSLVVGIFCLFIFLIIVILTIYCFDTFMPSWIANDDDIHKQRVDILHMSCDELKNHSSHGVPLNTWNVNEDYYKHRLEACA